MAQPGGRGWVIGNWTAKANLGKIKECSTYLVNSTIHKDIKTWSFKNICEKLPPTPIKI